MEGQERNLRKTRVGEVVSTKMDKTIVVRVSEVRNILYTRKLFITQRNSRFMMRIMRQM